MIPLKDDAPRYSTPYVNYFIVALNVLAFLFELTLPRLNRQVFILQFGFVPARVTALLHGAHSVRALGVLLPVNESAVLTVITAMFLHASWLHLLGNMWFLWIFGDNIEDHLGHFKYLLFYLCSGFAAALLHTFFNPGSPVPSVGASGAIAGVMGAYFVLFPSARVLTLVPFLFVFFLWLPAWIILGYWFVIQFLSGAATSIAYSSQTGGGIAFWAHVGGFVGGIVMIKLFPSHRRRRFRYDA
ncbi:MAG: rhomboid family intramembrane serine protease [Acidobacteriia bacterium]|nr:rhomboid family intramembrane serine protease [Terriglobia bacterium]